MVGSWCEGARRRGLAALSAIVAAACGVTPSSAPTPSTGARAWVDSVLATMSPRDKAAQLVWPQLFGDYTPASSAGWERVRQLISRDHVGGFIMSIGSPIETAVKINAMQQLSTLPLVFGADYETGVGFRQRGGYFLPNNIYLGGGTIFPYQMALGATRDTSLAYEQGRITAIEGRALGVHIAFAPVLDVNNNPANPVIGMRSFGEDPHLVAAMGRALIHGLQDHGMVATGKHFPGHGDTDENSHLTITTVHASRARIDSVELVPFRSAIAGGVQGMMTFHGLIPALDTASIPATLNPAIMTGLLRKQLGFKGLLITDAMDMNGVLSRVSVPAAAAGQTVSGNYGAQIKNALSIAEACKLAVSAGADILLMPSDVPAAIDAVVEGVRQGRFTQARVDSSVRRVLEIKQRLGLERRRVVDLDSVRAIVGDTAHLRVAASAAQRSITLARDSLSLVPLARTGTGTAAPRLLSITIATRADLPAGATFNAELRAGTSALRTELVNPEDSTPGFDRLLQASDSSDVTVVGSYLSTGSTVTNPNAPEPIAAFMRTLVQRHPRTIIVAFGNPYLLQQVPSASTYVVAWGGFPVSQSAAARALLGSAPIGGRLPISIPPLLRFGAGEDRAAVARAPSP
ncbi:MAG TPA: glycoside hydrolase family 3 N-terminal domain-containing protein [Gemmatimonadaceae bacterium]|nr:glycoside hydrolase family 3 N-terminal domain-containing protein [Gemmatimonadaceae bacterium]